MAQSNRADHPWWGEQRAHDRRLGLHDRERLPPLSAERARSVPLMEWVVNRPSHRVWPRLGLRELWDYRDVGLMLALRDLKVRYKQTRVRRRLGGSAAPDRHGVFTLIFGTGIGVSSAGSAVRGVRDCGLAVWFPFNTARRRRRGKPRPQSRDGHEGLLPPAAWPDLAPRWRPWSTSASPCRSRSSWSLWRGRRRLQPADRSCPCASWAPSWSPLAFGVWLSALNVLYRDVRYALGFSLQVLFFISPVVYATLGRRRRLAERSSRSTRSSG